MPPFGLVIVLVAGAAIAAALVLAPPSEQAQVGALAQYLPDAGVGDDDGDGGAGNNGGGGGDGGSGEGGGGNTNGSDSQAPEGGGGAPAGIGGSAGPSAGTEADDGPLLFVLGENLVIGPDGRVEFELRCRSLDGCAGKLKIVVVLPDGSKLRILGDEEFDLALGESKEIDFKLKPAHEDAIRDAGGNLQAKVVADLDSGERQVERIDIAVEPAGGA